MDRRTFAKNETATSGALAAAELVGIHSESQGGSPPNILLILMDELRAADRMR